MFVKCKLLDREVNWPCPSYIGECPYSQKCQKEAYMTNEERIRAMSDEELTDAIYQLINAMDPATWFCKGSKECGDLMDADKDIPDEMCKKCLLAKLREPAEGV